MSGKKWSLYFPVHLLVKDPFALRLYLEWLILKIYLDRVDVQVVFLLSVKQENLQKASRLVDKLSNSPGF